jgi:hypothetical protein
MTLSIGLKWAGVLAEYRHRWIVGMALVGFVSRLLIRGSHFEGVLDLEVYNLKEWMLDSSLREEGASRGVYWRSEAQPRFNRFCSTGLSSRLMATCLGL